MCLICYFLPPLQWDPAEVRSQSSTPERGGLALSPPPLICLHSHPGLWLPAAAEPLTASLLRSLWPRSGTEKYPPSFTSWHYSLSLFLFGSVPSTPAVEKHYTDFHWASRSTLEFPDKVPECCSLAELVWANSGFLCRVWTECSDQIRYLTT